MNHWESHFSSVKLQSALPILSAERQEWDVPVPAGFKALCKGNVNNAKVLLICFLRNQLVEDRVDLQLAYQHGSMAIPLDMCSSGNAREDAKLLLPELKQHLQHLNDFVDPGLGGLVVSDSSNPALPSFPLSLMFSKDLETLHFSVDLGLSSIADEIRQMVLELMAERPTAERNAYWHQCLADYRVRCYDQQNSHRQLLDEAWNAVFATPLRGDLSFQGNGGDSIQAIRMLAKMKEQGAAVNLSELLSLTRMDAWRFEIGAVPASSRVITSSDRYPLAEMQQKIWGHYQAMKTVGAYHEQFLFELEKSPAIEVLESCLSAIWNSYDQLRVRIQEGDDDLFQRVSKAPLEVSHGTWTSIEEALAEDLARGFPEGLLRITFCRVKGKHYLLWTHHHVILDGWSVGILIRDFLQRVAIGDDSIHPRTNHQLQLTQIERENRLSAPNDSSALGVPFRLDIDSFQWHAGFEEHHFRLGGEGDAEPKTLQKLGVTRQVLCAAALFLALRSMDSTEGLYIHGISSGRNVLEGDMDEAVGLFIRNVSLPLPEVKQQTAAEWVKEVHQSLQSRLTETFVSEPKESADLLFVFENYPYEDIQSEGFQAKLISVKEVTGYPITFCVFPRDEGYDIRMVYDARRIDHHLIQALEQKFKRFHRLLVESRSDDPIRQPLLDAPPPTQVVLDVSTFDPAHVGGDVFIPSGPSWTEVFSDVEVVEQTDDPGEGGLVHWNRFAFSEYPGIWRNASVPRNGEFREVRLEGVHLCGKDLMEHFAHFLRDRVWQHAGFQWCVAQEGEVFPMALDDPNTDAKLLEEQWQGLKQHRDVFKDFIAGNLPIHSNLLCVLDEAAVSSWEAFELVLVPSEKGLVIWHQLSMSQPWIQGLQNHLEGSPKQGALKPRESITFNDSPVELTHILDAFQSQVQRRPNATAIRDEQSTYTFAELDQLTNQAAGQLERMPEFQASSYIGIQMPRSAEVLIAVLAILKSGKAFVPVDVSWPEPRVQQVMKQAEIKLILKAENLMALQQDSAPLRGVPNQLDRPAYALFTSGSTGVPKGVAIAHRALSNYLAHCQNSYFQQTDPGTVHVFTPLSFDFTLTELLGGLVNGCEINVHSEHVSPYESLQICLQDAACHVAKLTPSHIQLAEPEWFERATPKTFVVGGEALQASHAAACLSNPDHRLINEYGPTEVTVGCTVREVQRGEVPLIGTPIAGMGVAVMDDHGRPVPRGVEGELYVTGTSLASGYLNDAALTVGSFLKLETMPQGLVYKTGDVVCMQEDGNLLFVSRKDGQLKLNGYRIETDEIRKALYDTFALESHACIVPFNQGNQLVCFVQTSDPNIAFYDALASALPPYMIPHRFVVVAAFPTTANGKLDEAALLQSLPDVPVAGIDQALDSALLGAWLNRDDAWKHALHTEHLRRVGWKRVQQQLAYLKQIKSLPKGTIYCGRLEPQGLIPSHLVPAATKNAGPLRLRVNSGMAVRWEGLQHIAGILNEQQVSVPVAYAPIVSHALRSLLHQADTWPLIPVLASSQLPMLPSDAICLVKDWSEKFTFPMIVQRMPNGEWNWLLNDHEWRGNFDRLRFPQSEGVPGRELVPGWAVYTSASGFTGLADLRSFERFGNRVRNTSIERLVRAQAPAVPAVLCEIVDGAIVLFVQGPAYLESRIQSILQEGLPVWCTPQEVVMSEDLIESVRSYRAEHKNDGFNRFLRSHLPEFSYLNGHLSLIEQGGDSITALRIVGKLRGRGFDVDLGALLNAPSLSEWIGGIVNSEGAIQVTGHATELTPIQQWFLQHAEGNKNHYNQPILLELLVPGETQQLAEVLRTSLRQFQILQKVYRNGWVEGMPPQVAVHSCTHEAEITAHCTEIQKAFDLERGPVAGGAIFERNGQLFLFAAIHHFYCDGYSWRVFLDELQATLSGQAGAHFGPEVFGKVHQRFLELAEANQTESSSYYGTEITHPFKDWSRCSLDESTYLEWEWDAAATSAFTQSSGFGAASNEKFLFLFLRAWAALKLPPTAVFFETHGRSYDGVSELSDSLGWFTQFYPVFAHDWPAEDKLLESIQKAFEDLPHSGLTYMAQPEWQQPPFPVLLNYLGNFDEDRGGIAAPSTIAQGPMSDGKNLTLSVVEVNAMIRGGRMTWMLRTHPDFDAEAFQLTFNRLFDEISQNQNTSDYISNDIDEADLDAIDELLGNL